MRTWLLGIAIAVAGCSVVLPVAVSQQDVPPDRAPKQDRVLLALAFGMAIDSVVIGAVYTIRRLAKQR